MPFNKKEEKNSIKIIGDIFTNWLCLNVLFDKNTIFYSEYFEIWNESFTKKFLSKIFTLQFRNKIFLVPTKQSYDFFSKISKKVLYFPQLYIWNINNNPISKQKNDTINILYIGNLSDWKKNIEFIFKIIYKLQNKWFKLTLVWQENKNLFDKYQHLFVKWIVKYLWFKNHQELEKIYQENDIFLFPSISDPIGAVVLEAMAWWLAIITNKFVWASSYLNNNWFILDNYDNIDDYIEKLLFLKKNIDILNKFKQKSIEIVKNNYWIKNEKLLEQKYLEFNKFIND